MKDQYHSPYLDCAVMEGCSPDSRLGGKGAENAGLASLYEASSTRATAPLRLVYQGPSAQSLELESEGRANNPLYHIQTII